MIKKYIYVTTQKEDFHSYPDAPTEVAFLRNVHRHLFKIKLKIEIFDNNRELEFFIVQRKLNDILLLTDFNCSCENIASQILDAVKLIYPNRDISCEVSEDGENGGIIEWQAEQMSLKEF